MKKALILLSALLGVLNSFAEGNTFEGNLTLTSDKNGTVAGKNVLAVKNDLVAIDPGVGQQMVLNVKTGDFFTVVNQGGQKMVAKLNVSVLSNLSEMPSFLGPFSNHLGGKSDESEVKATDEVKTISGYKCKKYIVKDAETVSTIWAAQDFPFSLAPLMDLLKATGSTNPALKASFPMQASVKSTKTNDVTGFSVAVEKKALDDKLFTLPADLLVMDMTPLVQQMLQTNDPAQITKVLNSLIPK